MLVMADRSRRLPVDGDTLDACANLAPGVVVPTRFTGWKATHAFARPSPTLSSTTASAPPSTSARNLSERARCLP